MPYFRTNGKQKRSRWKTWWMVRARKWQAIRRYNSVGNKIGETVYNISGWTLVVSTNLMLSSLQRPSIQCFGGTGMRVDATYICWMSHKFPPDLANKSNTSWESERHMVYSKLDPAGAFCADISRVFLEGERAARQQDIVRTPDLRGNRYFS